MSKAAMLKTGVLVVTLSASAGAPALADEGDSATNAGSIALEEVVVTAQKRAERLQDTPVPVTALNTNDLVTQNQTRLQDYFTQVPGLSLNPTGDGSTNIVIRGIAAAVYSNPTVGVTIDDVPVGATSALANGQLQQPDLDPSDLAQIEVLRGPQGTLYGASSLGGLIKYVTTDPSTKGYSGRLQADVNSTDGGGVGYGVRGSINVPVSDTLAVRASGFSRRTAGYLDNVATGQNNLNSIDAAGGHFSLLWMPSDLLSVKLGVLYQYTHANGGSAINTDFYGNPTYGDLKESFVPGSGAYYTENALYSAKVDVHLGWADLTSVTGYNLNIFKGATDSSLSFDNPPYDLPSSEIVNRFHTNKVSQELRLASHGGEHWDWLLGGFYTHEHNPVEQDINGVDPNTGAVLQSPLQVIFPTTYQEFAAFGDATYHFTDAFDLQGGLRYSHNRQTYNEADYGSLGEIAPGVPFTTAQDSTDHSLTFLVVPQLKLTPDMMAYIRVASGYRPGGPNADAVLFNLPGTFKADTTLNYELGLKGDVLHGAFTYDLSAFYVDWHSIQLQIKDPVSQFSFFANGGTARSTGLEAALNYRTDWGLHLAANASYDVAELSQTPPPSIYASNDARLPYSPRFSGSLSADENFRINSQWTGFVGGTVAYVGQRYGDFPSTADSVRPVFPSYTTLDLRTGALTGPWTVNLFARNVTNERGVLTSRSLLGAVALLNSPYITNFIPPRTVGLSVARDF